MVAAADVLSEARRAGFKLDAAQAEGLAAYSNLLAKWNGSTNLVGSTAWPELFRDLLADSLHLAAFLRGLDLPADPLCLDLGAGAGLPGVPLRLVWQNGRYVMVEPRQKRAAFLFTVLGSLKPPRTEALAGRAEDAAPRVGRADLIVSRAFMPWERLLPFCLPLLKPGGQVVVMASEPPPQELPSGFSHKASAAYAAGGKKRYFWSVSPASISM